MKKDKIKKIIGLVIFLLGLIYMFYLLYQKNEKQTDLESSKQNTFAPQN